MRACAMATTADRNHKSNEKGIELIQCGVLWIQAALGMNWSGRRKGATVLTVYDSPIISTKITTLEL
jgi:hypothetical protein